MAKTNDGFGDKKTVPIQEVAVGMLLFAPDQLAQSGQQWGKIVGVEPDPDQPNYTLVRLEVPSDAAAKSFYTASIKAGGTVLVRCPV